jgi:hypothetical protein
MKARLRNGFVVNGRLAKIFADRGIATLIDDNQEVPIKVVETKEQKNINEPVKRTRRTKAQIEADKNREA